MFGGFLLSVVGGNEARVGASIAGAAAARRQAARR
jgi:hypothetical protein